MGFPWAFLGACLVQGLYWDKFCRGTTAFSPALCWLCGVAPAAPLLTACVGLCHAPALYPGLHTLCRPSLPCCPTQSPPSRSMAPAVHPMQRTDPVFHMTAPSWFFTPAHLWRQPSLHTSQAVPLHTPHACVLHTTQRCTQTNPTPMPSLPCSRAAPAAAPPWTSPARRRVGS